MFFFFKKRQNSFIVVLVSMVQLVGLVLVSSFFRSCIFCRFIFRYQVFLLFFYINQKRYILHWQEKYLRQKLFIFKMIYFWMGRTIFFLLFYWAHYWFNFCFMNNYCSSKMHTCSVLYHFHILYEKLIFFLTSIKWKKN